MGIDIQGAWILKEVAASYGLGNICSFGVQDWNISSDFHAVLKQTGCETAYQASDYLHTIDQGYSIFNIDASDYQKPDLVYDLSVPLDTNSSLLGNFSSLIDFGTSEHVLGVSNSILNGINLLQHGGIYIANLPCNNGPLHGLYQISPNLFAALDTHKIMKTEVLMAMPPVYELKDLDSSALVFLSLNRVSTLDTNPLAVEWFNKSKYSNIVYVGKKITPLDYIASANIYQSSFITTAAGDKLWSESFAGKNENNSMGPNHDNRVPSYVIAEIKLETLIYGGGFKLISKLTDKLNTPKSSHQTFRALKQSSGIVVNLSAA